MRKMSKEKLFQMLCNRELELLTYIYRSQGEDAAPINFYETAQALSIEKYDVRKAFKRLVDAKIILADEKDGTKFKISDEIFYEG